MRVLIRYLVTTQDVGITCRGKLNSVGYCDSYLAGSEGRQSTAGYTFLLGGGAISWSSKLQPTIATAEADYMAAASAMKEALWLRHMLLDLRVEIRALLIKRDNTCRTRRHNGNVGSTRPDGTRGGSGRVGVWGVGGPEQTRAEWKWGNTTTYWNFRWALFREAWRSRDFEAHTWFVSPVELVLLRWISST
ncbi:hypothetical protein Vretimale_13432 [Volvox reticuliferus]|uniref:Uncharacterized protein n=1 Tax=Volvox reticuliferus TaxID=1737510 RepID=A0A8J4FCK0_9CHLO|nr:hypothetical protein Vretifemale_260 [Volvox reticuliferus]GIM09585.1 hypothetical protein Vretimale_13432 [Volvox reticuliferus]